MLLEFLKSIIVGICASAPFGPVAVFIFQRTLCYGPRSGRMSGLGSAVVDMCYAVISLFAVSAIQAFVSSNKMWIMIAGGAIIAVVGFRVAGKNTVRQISLSNNGVSHVGGALKAAGCALANPGALALMLTLVSVFGLGRQGKLMILADAAAVFAGEMLYWTFFTWIVNRAGENIRPESVRTVSKLAGIVIALLGAVLIIKGIKML